MHAGAEWIGSNVERCVHEVFFIFILIQVICSEKDLKIVNLEVLVDMCSSMMLPALIKNRRI